MRNIILKTDGYKPSHWKQYPKNTQIVHSYFESRGGEFDEICFFGLQYFINKYLVGRVLTVDMILEADQICHQYFGNAEIFNREGWYQLMIKHKGTLPLKIKAVPEGSIIPTRNVLMTVENTDPEFPWLTNYVETLLSNLWYPCTVASQSREMKKIIGASLQRTGDPNGIPFKLHDFGQRGVTCPEQAAIGGAAHLVNFLGSDTLLGIVMLRDFYRAGMPGFSIPATEHSTMTIYGREHEEDAVANHLEAFPEGLLATVGDSYDIYNYIDNILGKTFKDQIVNRKGTLIVRPDSGDPPTTVVSVLDHLGAAFGFSVNAKGFKVLPPYIRMIQGDGIDFCMIKKIIAAVEATEWSLDNVAFGSGGGLLQKMNRDTCKFAFKCSAAKIDGEWRDVYKDPITDPGKQSKRGLLALVKDEFGEYNTITYKEGETVAGDLLETRFLNGASINESNLDEIRERAKL